MEELNATEANVIKADIGKHEKTATPTPSSSAATSPDSKSLVTGLQAANTSVHALDQANLELIEALGEAEREIERCVRLS